MNYSLRRLIVPVFMSALPALFAAGGPPPVTVNQPVNVVVTNSDMAPAQVQDVNNPAFQPYQASDAAGVQSPNGYYKTAKFAVPAGKRLVIELVTFYVVLDGGQTVSEVELEVLTPGGTTVIHHLTPSRIGPSPGSATGIAYSVTQPLRAYSEAGANSVALRVERNGTTGLYLTRFSISGYLVDVP